jgi:hypothetical protein
LTAEIATTGTFCERATAKVGKSNRGDVDALLLEIALLFGNKEHRVVAAHDVVELHGHLVGGERCGAEQGDNSSDRQCLDEFHVSLLINR